MTERSGNVRWGTRVVIGLAWLMAFSSIRLLLVYDPYLLGPEEIAVIIGYNVMPLVVAPWVTWRLWPEARWQSPWRSVVACLVAALLVLTAEFLAYAVIVTYEPL